MPLRLVDSGDLDEFTLRCAVEQTRQAVSEAAHALAQAVKETTDDKATYDLADALMVALKLERRIRRLLAVEVAS